MKATWNNQLTAENNHMERGEIHCLFAKEHMKTGFLEDSSTDTNCPLKVIAFRYILKINGVENKDMAWVTQSSRPSLQTLSPSFLERSTNNSII